MSRWGQFASGMVGGILLAVGLNTTYWRSLAACFGVIILSLSASSIGRKSA